MAKTWTFRITSEGLKELERDLKGLGTEGARVFNKLQDAAPGLANGLRGADAALAKTKDRLTQVARESSATGKALGAAGREAAVFADGFAQRLGPVGVVMGAIGPAGLVAAAGVGALTAAFTASIMAAENAERAQRKMELVLRATGNAAGLTANQLGQFATQMQNKTLFGDSQIKEASARLATFRGIAGDTFKRVIRDAADLATVFDMDLNSAVLKLGKALEDPISGYDDLTKSGVRLSAAQRDLVVSLVKSGELAKAQGIILGELEKRVGGAAEGEQTGLTGSINRLGDSWNVFIERMGNSFGVIGGLTGILDGVIERSERWAKVVHGATPAESLASLRSDLARAEQDLTDAKKTASNDKVHHRSFGDTVIAEAQANVDAIKMQIEGLETLTRWTKIATTASENYAISAGEQAMKDAAAAAQAGALADELTKATTSRAEASKKLDEFVHGLEIERLQIGMSSVERARQNSLLELESQIKSGLININDKGIAQARTTIDLIVKETEEWETLLGFMDEMAKNQKKDDDAAKDRLKAIEDIAKEQQRIADRQADLLAKPFENALDGVQRSFTDFFDDIYNNGIDSFSSLSDGVFKMFTHLAAELSTLLIFQPQLLGGATGQSLGSSGVGVTGVNGGNSLTGGFNLSNLLSPGTFSAGQWNTGIGTMLLGNSGSTLGAMGKGGAGVSSQIAPGTASAGLFGLNGAGQLSSMLNSPIGGGAFAGLAAGAATYASGGTGAESIGAGLGAAAGGIAGSYFGPIGTMVGSTIGGMLGKMVGGLFGKKDKYKKVKSTVGASLGFDEFGMLDMESSFAKTKGKGVTANAGEGAKLGGAVVDAFNDFFSELGAEFDPSADAQVQGVYQARVKGKKKKGEKTYYYGSFAGENVGTANTAEELLPMFLSGSLAIAVEKGLVTGVSDTIKAIFTNVFNENNRVGVSDPEDLTRMVEFGKFYDRVDQIRNPAQAAAEAIKELERNMRAAKSTADEFGLAVDHIDSVFRDNFAEGVADELLGLKDPEALALKELEKEKAARVAVAERLGIAIADVEELYALKRQAIVEQGLSSVGSSFQTFFDGLVYGADSAVAPEMQLAGAKSAYDAAVASGDKGAFLPAADQYLSLMREFFASTPEFVAAFKDVLAQTKALGGLTSDIPQFAGGGIAHGLARVGEKGEELINIGSPSRIINGRQAAQFVAGLGDGGDTQLIHTNKSEVIGLLHRMGGSGTINSRSGLLEFKYGADTKEGGATGKQSGGANSKGDGKGGNKSSGGTPVDKAYKEYADSMKAAGMQNTGDTSQNTGNAAGSFGGPAGPTRDMYQVQDQVAANVNEAVRDQSGIDDSVFEKVVNFFAGLVGFNEMDPTAPGYSQPNMPGQTGRANWGWDPVVGLASLAGLVAGIPGLGLVADQISDLLGRPFEINMGADVFGGAGAPGSAPSGTVGGSGSSAADAAAVDRMSSLSSANASPTRDLETQRAGNSSLFRETGSAATRQLQALQREVVGLRQDMSNAMRALTQSTAMNNAYLRYDRT
nr:phage tail length tape measure family protein [uncultured Dongia sp.]